MANRNFLCSMYGLLGVVLPIKPTLGKVNNCELILIIKFYVDEKGDTNLIFHRYLSHKSSGENLHMLMKKGTIHNYFSMPLSASMKSLNITYMNSLQNLTYYTEGYQLSENGPDSYMINYAKIDNPIGLKWKQKSTSSFLPVKRKHSREFLHRRLKNSLGIMRVYVIPDSEIEQSYIHDKGTKLFLITYEIETHFV